ncbi:WD40-repeat-containing domain [Pseudocohnilembus persalinus]|uniref:WD40-repeat-containing domain n=1 Tax=Pseudocohnilembus persalinus TaxID=266149 RepID=A0A0V0QLP3_PSEPJ|nr:WD40-repeat-containing domain [Pseudocohnilembus persalinus]|eukprot:KRX02977.1 WD40-repeat-containing domain [Pseudocohnilembus persalinus]
MRKVNIKEGIMITFAKLIELFDKSTNNQQLALQNWQKIHFCMLKTFLNQFGILDQIDTQEIGNYIKNLIFASKIKEAVGIYKVFPNVKEKLDIKEIIIRLITQAHINEAEEFVGNDQNLRHQLTKKLYYEKAIFYINKYEIDHTQFPVLQERFKKAKLEKLVKKQDYQPDKIEEIISYSSEMHNLVECKEKFELLDDKIKDQYLKNNYGYVQNPILEKDGFGNSQEICYNDKSVQYVSYQKFNITEKDVIFVDIFDLENPEIKECYQSIKNADILGFDTEFEPKVTNFSQSGIATLQLATTNKTYIFDVPMLKLNQNFIDFIERIFTDPKIIKVGHSISQDFNKMANNLNLSQDIVEAEHGWIDISMLYMKQTNRKNIESLSTLVTNLIGGKLDKTEQVSNWIKRPLRKTQLHYAGMDAFICLKLYQVMQDLLQQGELKIKNLQSTKSKKKDKNKIGEKMITVDNIFSSSEQYKDFWENPRNVKFLVDNMLYKLVKYLRNVGIDTAYIKNVDKNLLIDLSKQEKRIVITRDQKFFYSKQRTTPVYMLTDNNQKTEQQFREIMRFFKIDDLQQFLLSRCVHCNSDKLEITDADTVKKYLHFKREEDYNNYEFWICLDCKQIYWEGATFQKSKQRFKELTENINNDIEDKWIDKKINENNIYQIEPQFFQINQQSDQVKQTQIFQLENLQKQYIISLYQNQSNTLVLFELDCNKKQKQVVQNIKLDTNIRSFYYFEKFQSIVLFTENRQLQIVQLYQNPLQLEKLEINYIQQNNDIVLNQIDSIFSKIEKDQTIENQNLKSQLRQCIFEDPSSNEQNQQFYVILEQDIFLIQIEDNFQLKIVKEKKVAKLEQDISHISISDRYIFIALNSKKIHIINPKDLLILQEFNPLFNENQYLQELEILNPFKKNTKKQSNILFLAASNDGQLKICEWSQKLIQYNILKDLYLSSDVNVKEENNVDECEQQIQLQDKKKKITKKEQEIKQFKSYILNDIQQRIIYIMCENNTIYEIRKYKTDINNKEEKTKQVGQFFQEILKYTINQDKDLFKNILTAKNYKNHLYILNEQNEFSEIKLNRQEQNLGDQQFNDENDNNEESFNETGQINNNNLKENSSQQNNLINDNNQKYYNNEINNDNIQNESKEPLDIINQIDDFFLKKEQELTNTLDSTFDTLIQKNLSKIDDLIEQQLQKQLDENQNSLITPNNEGQLQPEIINLIKQSISNQMTDSYFREVLPIFENQLLQTIKQKYSLMFQTQNYFNKQLMPESQDQSLDSSIQKTAENINDITHKLGTDSRYHKQQCKLVQNQQNKLNQQIDGQKNQYDEIKKQQNMFLESQSKFKQQQEFIQQTTQDLANDLSRNINPLTRNSSAAFHPNSKGKYKSESSGSDSDNDSDMENQKNSKL